MRLYDMVAGCRPDPGNGPLATGNVVMVYNRGLGKGRSVRPPLLFPAPRTMQISLTPDYSLLAIMVIFIINYFIVSRFFIRPINAVLESRAYETRSANEIYEAA